MAHLIYAYVENRGGHRRIDGELVSDDSMIHRYLKTFQSKEVFDTWQESACGPGGHLSIIKWWRDRPPCRELAAVRQEFPEDPQAATRCLGRVARGAMNSTTQEDV